MEKFSIEEESGEKVYKDERGEKIDTYRDTLRDILSLNLEPLHDFLKMLPEEDETQSMMFIAEALLERAENKVYAAIDYLDKNYGELEIIKASYRQYIKPETMLDIKFTPTN
jgi:hypothetical protein